MHKLWHFNTKLMNIEIATNQHPLVSQTVKVIQPMLDSYIASVPQNLTRHSRLVVLWNHSVSYLCETQQFCFELVAVADWDLKLGTLVQMQESSPWMSFRLLPFRWKAKNSNIYSNMPLCLSKFINVTVFQTHFILSWLPNSSQVIWSLRPWYILYRWRTS